MARIFILFSIFWLRGLNVIECGGIFPFNSALGIFVAIAVPLDLPNRNVFMSYNFEANYNLPYLGSDAIPGPLTRFTPPEDPVEARLNVNNEPDLSAPPSSNSSSNTTNESTEERHKRNTLKSVISRTSIYKMLEEKLKNFGLNGKQCLLKLICETNAAPLHQENGVLGNIFHIIFTPSSSVAENLTDDYYSAEVDGLELQCHKYNQQCPESVLDLISQCIN